MAAILNSAILDSDTAILDSNTLLSSLRFTQKHSSSTLTLIPNFKLWWWQPSWILPTWIQTMMATIFKLNSAPSWSHWILPSWIQPCCTKLWLKLQSDSNSFILTQLDDGSHLEFCHVGFRHCHLGFKHLVIFSQIHSKTLFLHSDFDSN